MAIVDVKVPQLSESVAEATLLQWKKKPGEAVAADEILIEIETDKVVLELPAPKRHFNPKGNENGEQRKSTVNNQYIHQRQEDAA